MRQRNFFVSGPNFIQFFSSNRGGVVVDHLLLPFLLAKAVTASSAS